ncbi:NHL domain-containing protein [Flavipsychrobacter stenotrophus]|nr:T9SS type A sorting domain-containing protein [Flavipsychrobacter stenotrophus]
MKRIFSLFFFTLSICSFSAEAQYRKITTIAGTGGIGGYGGDGFVATAGVLNGPHNVAVSNKGEVYIVDFYNFRVRKIKTNGSIVTFAGNGITGYTGDNTAATNARMNPKGVAVDFHGNVYISDPVHSVIRKVNTLNIITTYVGTGIYGYTPTNTNAKTTRIGAPWGLACDKMGNLYFADAGNHVVCMVDTFGVITTLAGDGTAGFLGDGFGALTARLDSPYAVAVDRTGNVFVADHNNSTIRMIDVAGNINKVAGTIGSFGNAGDLGLAINAQLNYPTGVAVDTAGNVYISDSHNNVIRMVDASGVISTIVANGFPGFGGDLGDAIGANLWAPYGICVDSIGAIFIADANNQRVRRVYNATVGVNNVDPNSGLNIYPNPFNNNITVAGLHKNDVVCLYDLMGRPVMPQVTVDAEGVKSFEIGDIAQGIYLLQVNNAKGDNRVTAKMIK